MTLQYDRLAAIFPNQNNTEEKHLEAGGRTVVAHGDARITAGFDLLTAKRSGNGDKNAADGWEDY